MKTAKINFFLDLDDVLSQTNRLTSKSSSDHMTMLLHSAAAVHVGTATFEKRWGDYPIFPSIRVPKVNNE